MQTFPSRELQCRKFPILGNSQDRQKTYQHEMQRPVPDRSEAQSGHQTVPIHPTAWWASRVEKIQIKVTCEGSTSPWRARQGHFGQRPLKIRIGLQGMKGYIYKWIVSSQLSSLKHKPRTLKWERRSLRSLRRRVYDLDYGRKEFLGTRELRRQFQK